MGATYPTTKFTWSTRVDNVDDVLAADVNSLADEVIALEDDLVGAGEASGLKEGAASFHDNWNADHNTDGSHKQLNCATQATDLTLKDNEASALDIKEGANSYLKFVTTDSGEKIVPGKKVEAGAVEIEGSAFDINGGAIDGTPIGAASTSTGHFTTGGYSGAFTMVASTGNKIAMRYSFANTSKPPTKAELNSAFASAITGELCFLMPNYDTSSCYLCIPDGTDWQIVALTKRT